MKKRFLWAVVMLILSASCSLAAARLPKELTAIQEAYQAALDNLVSGSGTGTYEIYAAPSGKEAKLELEVNSTARLWVVGF
jgi:hypothetical protein